MSQTSGAVLELVVDVPPLRATLHDRARRDRRCDRCGHVGENVTACIMGRPPRAAAAQDADFEHAGGCYCGTCVPIAETALVRWARRPGSMFDERHPEGLAQL